MTPRVITDARRRPFWILVSWFAALVTVGYLLPWAVATTRGKSNAGAIGLLNLLLGWTVIGWVIALVMASAAHQVVAVRD